MNRDELAAPIVTRISLQKEEWKRQWQEHRVRSFVVDDLLPDTVARAIFATFPPAQDMTLKESLRERKLVSAQMNKHHRVLEEAIYAFQDVHVTALLEEITGLKRLEPDSQLYAGGISMMTKGHFLNPHIDNSHDKDRARYRVLNLLYYITPDWKEEYGGNLELWNHGPKGHARTIVSRFNRLVVMQTDRHSWHSVNPVRYDGRRCCISNYTFSPHPADTSDYFHVTSFRGRPEQPMRDVVLQADGLLRMGIRKFFPKGIFKTGHVYEKEDAA
jgi:Rps23 Pro-64 3,4-dihydroxylase Tpa1-like proline 4-hydroxylase